MSRSYPKGLDKILKALMDEQNIHEPLPDSVVEKRRLLRLFMNIRPPGKLNADLLAWQDEELAVQREEKGVVTIKELPLLPDYPRIRLWQGDITRLAADAIVNAANEQLLGCFSPLHNCIDNAIHSAAGLQLRDECAALMNAQSHKEAAGHAKITKAYNLPAKWVIHTVGPIIANGHVTAEDRQQLKNCYSSCLELAMRKELASIAFCCISTGVYGFPPQMAAKIAINTVLEFTGLHESPEVVIFDVYTPQDMKIYAELFGNA